MPYALHRRAVRVRPLQRLQRPLRASGTGRHGGDDSPASAPTLDLSMPGLQQHLDPPQPWHRRSHLPAVQDKRRVLVQAMPLDMVPQLRVGVEEYTGAAADPAAMESGGAGQTPDSRQMAAAPRRRPRTPARPAWNELHRMERPALAVLPMRELYRRSVLRLPRVREAARWPRPGAARERGHRIHLQGVDPRS